MPHGCEDTVTLHLRITPRAPKAPLNTGPHRLQPRKQWVCGGHTPRAPPASCHQSLVSLSPGTPRHVGPRSGRAEVGCPSGGCPVMSPWELGVGRLRTPTRAGGRARSPCRGPGARLGVPGAPAARRRTRIGGGDGGPSPAGAGGRCGPVGTARPRGAAPRQSPALRSGGARPWRRPRRVGRAAGRGRGRRGRAGAH